MAAANAFGDKLPILSLEKPKTYGASGTESSYPGATEINKKGWIDGIMLKERVRELDRKFASKRRNVALVIDNCPASPRI